MFAYGTKLRLIVLGLLSYAIKFFEVGGCIDIACEMRTGDGGHRVNVTVMATGNRIAEAQRAHLRCHPFR